MFCLKSLIILNLTNAVCLDLKFYTATVTRQLTNFIDFRQNDLCDSHLGKGFRINLHSLSEDSHHITYCSPPKNCLFDVKGWGGVHDHDSEAPGRGHGQGGGGSARWLPQEGREGPHHLQGQIFTPQLSWGPCDFAEQLVTSVIWLRYGISWSACL